MIWFIYFWLVCSIATSVWAVSDSDFMDVICSIVRDEISRMELKEDVPWYTISKLLVCVASLIAWPIVIYEIISVQDDDEF